ncbi:AAA family ATPase [Thalassobacillus hwangdonensis]|uniref:AAA family ATPase n=1 Tax=Thalassobacillus hwangdonensis TaxID=546108 RepID=A0ABW3KXP3_9BACI
MKHELKLQLQQWTSIDQAPPITEMEALKYFDETDMETDEVSATLYAVLAWYRIKRRPDQDQLVEFFIKQAYESKENDPLISQLFDAKQMAKSYHQMKKVQPEQWLMHETDHDSAKMKKAKTVSVEIEELLLHWDRELAEKTLVDASSRLKAYQLVYYHLNELKSLLAEAIETIENKRIRVPVKTINESIRSLSDAMDSLAGQLPSFYEKEASGNALEAFDQMIGLEDVKGYIQRYYHYLKYQQSRKELGFSMVDEPGLHMIITGNPGTGKTTIARYLANIYHELGILETKDVIEVNRSHLVGGYVGQSEENTMNYIKQAIGGVLFIDEAYSLKREGQTGNDYGQAVIDTLVSAMTSKEYGGKFAVILAGYPEEMRQFLWSNPGLRSRFPEQNHIELPDYNMEELVQIAESTALSNDYFFTDEALNKFEDLIDQYRVDDTFGNARTVKNLVLKTIFNKGAYEADKQQVSWLDHMRIDRQDLHLLEKKDDNEQTHVGRLEQLIGLNNVKQEVKKLSSFVKVQQERKDNGLPHVPIQLHSVFTGNPGTGKTTVAEIYAGILKECGLLKRGHMIVCSRSDLVAGYVGQSAIKTKKKVREALGGVLFIDEAYALYNGGRDDYGKEVIETLVDEMTRHDDNLVIIMAGYESEMRELIESNPGLSSRFKKYLHFPDYDAEQLMDMSIFQADQYKYELAKDAKEFLLSKYKDHAIRGNGRFVGNLIMEAIQFHALRTEGTEPDNSVLKEEDVNQAWHAVRGE